MASQLFPRRMACVASKKAITTVYAMPLPITIDRYGRGFRTLAEFPKLPVPRSGIPRQIAEKYQPFLLHPRVESSDWISKLQLEVVATMAEKSMEEDHKRKKVLVVFDSKYKHSPGKHVAYEACRLLHKLGFVVRALDIDSLEDRRSLGDKNQQPQSSLKERPSEDVSVDFLPIQSFTENETLDTLTQKPLENIPQSSPAYESEELSQVESQAPPAIQEASSHESELHFTCIANPPKKESQAFTHSLQEDPKLKDQVRPVDRLPLHLPRPEKEFFELVMWADAQIWCFPEKTNDLLSICNRHFKEETSPVLQGQPVPILYFNDTPSPVYQSHAIRHTIGKHRKLVPIPARTDLQQIRAHFSERMAESGIRTRFVDAVEDLAKYTLLLCRKKYNSIFKYKYSTEKAKARRYAAKSTALAGVTEDVESNEKPQNSKKIAEKKEAFTRLLDLPKEKVIKNPRTKKDPISKSVQRSDEVSQEAKLLRLKRLLGIEVAREQAEEVAGEEDESSKDVESTEYSQAADEVWPQNQPTREAGGARDSQVQEDRTPVDPQATEKTVLWSPLVRTSSENEAAKPSSFDSRD